jgi:hypothetical protein
VVLFSETINTISSSLVVSGKEDALDGHREVEESTVKTFTELELIEDKLVQMSRTRVERSLGQVGVQNQLNREYQVYNSVAAYTDGIDFTPILPLIQKEPIKDILARYGYFNFSALKVRVVLTTLPQQYGVIVFSRMPWYTPGGGFRNFDWFSIDPVLIPVTDQSSFEIELPYLYSHPLYPIHQDFLNDPTLAMNELYRMWTFRLAFHFDTTDTSVNQTVGYAVYASFVNPQVSAPVIKYVEPPVAEAQAMQPGGTFAAVSASIAAGYMAFKTATGTAQEVISTTQKAVNLGREFGNMMGTEHEKPTGMQQDPFGELSTPGVTMGRTLVYNPTVMTPSMVYGDPNRVHGMWQIMRENPQMYDLVKLTAGLSREVIPSPTCFLRSQSAHPGYMSYFAQFFKWWRGSVEVSFVMFTSPFISARMRLAFTFSPAALPAGYTEVGDIATVIRTVKGQATLAVEVPYIRSYARDATFEEPGEGQIPDLGPVLRMTVDRIMGVGDRAPAIWLAIFIRPGKDFAFEDPQIVRTSSAVAEAQMNHRQFFETVETLPGYRQEPVEPWNVTIEDFLSRWSVRGVSGDPLIDQRTLSPADGGIAKSNWDWLSCLFLFNSGEISYKLRGTTTGNTVMVLPWFRPALSGADVFNPGSGMAAVDVGLQPVMEVDIPFRHMQDVAWTEAIIPPTNVPAWVNTPVLNTTTTFQWVRMAATTQFYNLLPVPDPTLWPWLQEA